MQSNRFLDLILRRETVLIIFVLSAVVTSITTDFAEEAENTMLPLLSLVTFPVLAWFTHKGALLATWCTILLMLMSGSGFLYDAFFDLTKNAEPDYLLAAVQIFFGVYLTWGALILHRERHIRD